MSNFNKTIYLFWAQGWKNAPWLQKQAAESWKINNPNWNIELLDEKNIKKYLPEVDYLYDKNNNISMQSKSDIIRINLLNKYGGVWADSTLLCMQSLDFWFEELVDPYGFWTYHAFGAGLANELGSYGPCMWFLISDNQNYIIKKLKESCDIYWQNNRKDKNRNYFWLDNNFKQLFHNDLFFKYLWLKVPYIDGEAYGQSCILGHPDQNTQFMLSSNPNLKDLLLKKPPYVLKFWDSWNKIFPDPTIEKCKMTNGYHAIQVSKLGIKYKHKINENFYHDFIKLTYG
jgi:hypothetical protein